MRLNPTRALALAVLFAAAGAAQAQTQDDNTFAGMTRMDRMDTNKDGMVSKAEFMAAMERVWVMKTKEMKIKGDRIRQEDMAQILMYLRAGG